MIDRALALNLLAIAKREAANGDDHIAEVLRLTAEAVKNGADEIERLREDVGFLQRHIRELASSLGKAMAERDRLKGIQLETGSCGSRTDGQQGDTHGLDDSLARR